MRDNYCALEKGIARDVTIARECDEEFMKLIAWEAQRFSLCRIINIGSHNAKSHIALSGLEMTRGSSIRIFALGSSAEEAVETLANILGVKAT